MGEGCEAESRVAALSYSSKMASRKRTSSARVVSRTAKRASVVARKPKPRLASATKKRTMKKVRRASAKPLSIWQQWERDGLIGLIHDAPPDLSTNPKYMEGFGES